MQHTTAKHNPLTFYLRTLLYMFVALLLRLAVIGDVRDVLYMRTCQAQLGEYVDCLLVPEGALQEMSDTSIRSRPLAVLMMATVMEEEAFTWMGFWMYT